MFIASYALTAPAAYVSQIHYEVQDVTAICSEPPHPDEDLGGLSVYPVTGAPSELSPIQQVSFTVPVLMPLLMPESPPDFNRRVRAQTRALGPAHRPASKMQGRE